eukprot:1161845-Pelagomonas_calceolata.AAC.4
MGDGGALLLSNLPVMMLGGRRWLEAGVVARNALKNFPDCRMDPIDRFRTFVALNGSALMILQERELRSCICCKWNWRQS